MIVDIIKSDSFLNIFEKADRMSSLLSDKYNISLTTVWRVSRSQYRISKLLWEVYLNRYSKGCLHSVLR